MKLKEFDNSNRRKHTVRPTVGVNTKSGVFCFNATAAEFLGLSENDRIILLQDEEDTENWYIEKVPAEEAGRGFRVSVKSDGKTMTFCCTRLARNIFESVGYSEFSGTALLAGQPTILKDRTLFGILTNSISNRRKE